jgi:hypothetical protein
VKDVNGRAFTVLIDSVLPPTPPSPPEFVGIACDPIPAMSIEETEYKGWLAVEEEPVTSIDWNQHCTSAAENAFTVEPLNQTK